LLATLFMGGPANAACHLALALALDVSSSVDDAEYQLQRDGLASALLSKNVQDAFFDNPGDWVSLAVYEWSGRYQHAVILDWIEVRSPEALFSAAEKIASAERSHSEFPTALGYALGYSASLFAQAPHCDRATLDVSGDGPSNDGPRPRDLSSAGTTGAALPDITINALVIGPARGTGDAADDGGDTRPQNGRANGPSRGTGRPAQNLLSYFRAEVIAGPGAFAEPVEGYANYRTAMIRKLLREIRTLAIGAPSDPPSIRRLR